MPGKDASAPSPSADSNGRADSQQDPLLVAYRHDAHKFRGVSHAQAADTAHGVPVNQPVPQGADGDAAALSRPSGDPEQTVSTHGTHYRLSLLTGTSTYDSGRFTTEQASEAIADLLTESDPAVLHRAWLTSDVASGFNESVHYPYTSLKYHTLLVAALLDSYRAGHAFDDLRLVVDPPDEVVPHRTVYAGERFALRIDAAATLTGQPRAPLGSCPSRSWARTWQRLSAHPLDVDRDRQDMVLDANLRRIRSWSTALQYIEDVQREGRP